MREEAMAARAAAGMEGGTVAVAMVGAAEGSEGAPVEDEEVG